jgi:small GTP-binding protein
MSSLKEKPKEDQNDDEDSDDNKSDTDLQCNVTTIDLKITIVGNSGVGKTSIIHKFIDRDFDEKITATISATFKSKKIKIDPFTEANLRIWATAGQERYRSLTPNYIRGSNGILVVFDLAKMNSFEELDKWMETIRNVIAENKIEKILVGNKSDLPEEEKEVTNEMATKYADEHNMKYFSVSAKEGINIDILFEQLGNDCIKHLQEQEKEKEKEENKKEERLSALSGKFKNAVNENVILGDNNAKTNNTNSNTKKCC